MLHHVRRSLLWLDRLGAISVSCSPLADKCQDKLEAEFSPPDVIQRARRASDPVFKVGATVANLQRWRHHR